MIRIWAADVACWLGAFCARRARLWRLRGVLMVDVSEWLATPATWSEIRGRHGDGEVA
jgi:hypothetical protein